MLKTSWGTVDDEIAKYAYGVYEDRLRTGALGDAESDWFAGKVLYEEACERGRLKLIEIIERQIIEDDRRFLAEIIQMRETLYGKSSDVDTGAPCDMGSDCPAR